MTEAVAAPAEQKPAQLNQPAQAPATANVETAKPAGEASSQTAEQQQGSEASPKQEGEEGERHQSRAARRWNRMRDRAIAAETEARLMRERLAQFEGKPQSQQAQQQAPADDGSPKREQFGTYEEFIEAKATWKAEQAADARARKIIEDSKKAETERTHQDSQAKQQKEWEKHVDAARDAIDDFEDVCAESEAPVTPAMQAAIFDSGEKGPLIAYHLAKNPAEAERIAKLSPVRQAAAIVALEEKVSKPAKAPSKAPAPINPLGKAGDAESDFDTTKPSAAKNLSTEEWIRRDNERLAKQGKRI